MPLDAHPMSIKSAKEWVAKLHRHHKPPQGALFAVGATMDGEICGVAIIGRPVARMNDDGFTAEVTRLATDGTKNACSFLYAAAWRAARSLGYRRLLTYTLASEPGTSLRATGFREIGKAGGGSWSRPSRTRTDKHPTEEKTKWELTSE